VARVGECCWCECAGCGQYGWVQIDQGIWDAIINGPYTPKHIVDDVQVNKPWTQWTEEERRRAQYDCNAKNILTSSLNMDEFFRVSQCKSAKEM